MNDQRIQGAERFDLLLLDLPPFRYLAYLAPYLHVTISTADALPLKQQPRAKASATALRNEPFNEFALGGKRMPVPSLMGETSEQDLVARNSNLANHISNSEQCRARDHVTAWPRLQIEEIMVAGNDSKTLAAIGGEAGELLRVVITEIIKLGILYPDDGFSSANFKAWRTPQISAAFLTAGWLRHALCLIIVAAGRPVSHTATTSILMPPSPAERQPLKRMTRSQLSILSASSPENDPFPSITIFAAIGMNSIRHADLTPRPRSR